MFRKAITRTVWGWCALVVLPGRPTEARGILLSQAIEQADVVVVGKLVWFRGGTLWDSESREGLLRADQVLKGPSGQRDYHMVFSRGWLDYSLPAIIRRSWWLILLSAAAAAGAYRLAKAKGRERGVRVACLLSVLLVVLFLWALYLPLFVYGYQCEGPRFVSEMTDETKVWVLSRVERRPGWWRGGIYGLPLRLDARRRFIDQELDFARYAKFSPRTFAVLEKLKAVDLEDQRRGERE